MKIEKKITIVCIFILIITSLYYNLFLPFYEKRNVNNLLKIIAETMNNQCPYTTDDDLILEKVLFVKDKKILFEYKFIGEYDLDLEELKNDTINQLTIDGLVSTDGYKLFQNKNVVFEHVLLDNKNKEIARFKLLLNNPIIVID